METLTTKEIVAEYNLITGKKTKRFATRRAAEKALANARVKKFGTETKSATPVSKKANLKAALKKSLVPVKAVKEKKEPVDRSKAIAATWEDKAVRALRIQRSGVSVGNKKYKSCAAAFTELELPMSKCIRFRIGLKQAGAATFEYEGKKYNFKVTK